MWRWIEANWLMVLALLLALSCPLLHRWRRHDDPHTRRPQEPRRKG